jgi:hypothetical protein
MVCLMNSATSPILFTRLATRVIVVRVRSRAAQTFQSRTWGKDGSVASKYKTSITIILSRRCHLASIQVHVINIGPATRTDVCANVHTYFIVVKTPSEPQF